MSCKMICLKVKAKRPVGGGRYDNGQIRCKPCDVFILIEDCIKDDSGVLRCPCCKHRVRQNPRNKYLKIKLKKRREAKKK